MGVDGKLDRGGPIYGETVMIGTMYGEPFEVAVSASREAFFVEAAGERVVYPVADMVADALEVIREGKMVDALRDYHGQLRGVVRNVGSERSR